MTGKITRSKIEPVGILEVDTLSQNFNKMTDELKTMYENLEKKVEEGITQLRDKDHMLIKQSRQAAMGEMIQNIAHQWRQPLNSIGVIIQNIEDAYEYNELTQEYLTEKIAKVMGMVTYMSRTIDDFRNFFKPNKEKQSFLLKEPVNQVVSLVEGAFRNNNIQLLTEINSNKMVNGYENEFSQVLLNLLNNAKEIHIDRKTANAWVKVMVTEESGKHHVYVKDNGGGIVPGVEEKIFEPYFTTREMGTGLGLYMAKTIVENSMGGKLTAYNDQQGAIFEIML
jgi:C4-dicarboxylate-specific signal transduction histidine kinase